MLTNLFGCYDSHINDHEQISLQSFCNLFNGAAT